MFQPVDLLIEERHKDLMREVAMARLAVVARAGGTRAANPTLAALGHHLRVLGSHMERRYGEIKPEIREAAFQ